MVDDIDTRQWGTKSIALNSRYGWVFIGLKRSARFV
jgi:hypothetical protein